MSEQKKKNMSKLNQMTAIIEGEKSISTSADIFAFTLRFSKSSKRKKRERTQRQRAGTKCGEQKAYTHIYL